MKDLSSSISADQRAEVIRLVGSEGMLSAVIFIRGATGASLADAHGFVRAAAREEGLLDARPEGTQSSAEVVAVGPFRRELAPLLDYPADRYVRTSEGAPILTTVVSVEQDSGAVGRLASCFGIEPWDFNRHALDPAQLDVAKLGALFAPFLEEAAEIEEKVLALCGAGFTFHFHLRPES